MHVYATLFQFATLFAQANLQHRSRTMQELSRAIETLRAEIAACAARVGRTADAITIVAISKSQPPGAHRRCGRCPASPTLAKTTRRSSSQNTARWSICPYAGTSSADSNRTKSKQSRHWCIWCTRSTEKALRSSWSAPQHGWDGASRCSSRSIHPASRPKGASHRTPRISCSGASSDSSIWNLADS